MSAPSPITPMDAAFRAHGVGVYCSPLLAWEALRSIRTRAADIAAGVGAGSVLYARFDLNGGQLIAGIAARDAMTPRRTFLPAERAAIDAARALRARGIPPVAGGSPWAHAGTGWHPCDCLCRTCRNAGI